MRGRIVLTVTCCLAITIGCGGADIKDLDATSDGTTSSDSSSSSDATTDTGTMMEAGGDAAGDAGCPGTHPIVDGGARYCDPGHCYCMPTDKCFAMQIASGCCNAQVKCN